MNSDLLGDGGSGRDIRWAVVSTGPMADVFVSDLRTVPGAAVGAVSSRDPRRAKEFARRHGIPRTYVDYRELVRDAEVDVVYVATPHSQHHEVAKAALLAGKHVLCEKPITVHVPQAEELAALANQQGLLLLEAMWTRFNPLIRRLRELVADSAIGTVRAVRAEFGFAKPFEAAHRLWDPALGGGAVLDLGVYPVSLAHMLLGEPTEVVAHGSLAPSGVDAEAALLLRYPNGAHAYAGCSLVADLPWSASVTGTTGRIDIDAPFFRPNRITLVRAGKESEVHTIELLGRGYTYQAEEVINLLRAGATESPHLPPHESIAVMRTLRTALDQLGVHHPIT